MLYVDEYLNTRILDENYSIIVIIDYNNYTTSIYPVSDNPIDDINSILSINIKKNKNKVLQCILEKEEELKNYGIIC